VDRLHHVGLVTADLTGTVARNEPLGLAVTSGLVPRIPLKQEGNR
jgi:hypothetical protein